MKSPDPLDRLFHAAARVTRELPAGTPVNVERRVLASWRRGDGARVEWLDFLPLVRRGLAFACLMLVAALAWNYLAPATIDSDEATLIETTVAYSYYP